MTSRLIIAVLTFSSSIDNLGVGLSYGIRNIHISHFSNFVMGIICFLFSIDGVYFEMWMSDLIRGILPVVLDALILLIIGHRFILLAVPHNNQTSTKMNKSKPGSIIDVMNDPTSTDRYF